MRSLLSFVVLSLGLLATAEPVLSPYVLHEKRNHLPAGWTLKRRYDHGMRIPLRFALAQKNIDDIDKYLMEVSHPESDNYGKHWSASDIIETFAPSDETIEAVRSWLLESGYENDHIHLTPSKGWMEVTTTVEEAERLLLTEYNLYGHASGKEHIACDAYYLPEHIVPHVDFVTPSVNFDAKLSRRDTTEPARSIGQPGAGVGPKTAGVMQAAIPTDLSTCDEYITLDCLRALYGLDSTPPIATGLNSFGIVEYTPQAYLQPDLDMFFGNFSPELYGRSPFVISIDGGYAQTEYQGFEYNGESDLDLQYGMGLVGPSQLVTLYQTGDMIEGASFNNFLDALDASYCYFEGGDDPNQDGVYPDPYGDGYEGPLACGTAPRTNVISTSYGYGEADLSRFYAARQCTEYAKLGLMGTTILYSSGDNGVAGNGLCLTPNGTLSANGTVFSPTFPGTCPYVTSVGATMVPYGSTVYDPETACEEVIYSGGGFSNYFAMPEYQKSAVEYYLTNYYPDYPPGTWNTSGSRAFPDIAANGANYVVAIDGTFELVYGTSCSSPVSAAILTMINDARLAVGKSTIGFINPTIYSSAFTGVFNDITKGDNPGCGTNGFNATIGWDPVTGLGTPNYPKMLAAWLALP